MKQNGMCNSVYNDPAEFINCSNVEIKILPGICLIYKPQIIDSVSPEKDCMVCRLLLTCTCGRTRSSMNSLKQLCGLFGNMTESSTRKCCKRYSMIQWSCCRVNTKCIQPQTYANILSCHGNMTTSTDDCYHNSIKHNSPVWLDKDSFHRR